MVFHNHSLLSFKKYSRLILVNMRLSPEMIVVNYLGVLLLTNPGLNHCAGKFSKMANIRGSGVKKLTNVYAEIPPLHNKRNLFKNTAGKPRIIL